MKKTLTIGDKFLATKGFKTWDKDYNEVGVVAGTVIEYLGTETKTTLGGKRTITDHVFKNQNTGKTFTNLRVANVIEYKDGDPIPDFKAKIGYKIKYKGKFLKPKKFKDMGQIKVSLLIAFGYYDKLRSNADKKRNPELHLMEIPYWFEGREEISLDEFKDVEIVAIENKKETPVDFNAQEYIKESQVKLDAICKYGSVVKEMFSKIKDEEGYTYFLTITPDKYKEYDEAQWRQAYRILNEVEKLEENPLIKETIKKLGLKSKDFKKVTKYGKTAIAVNNEENLFRLMDAFYDLNIEVFATDTDRVREYSKEARRKQIINSL